MNSDTKADSKAGSSEKDIFIVRVLLGIVAFGLLVSGLTCYFLEWEVRFVTQVVWGGSPDTIPFMAEEYKLLVKVGEGLKVLMRDYPEFMLGTDWLGFAHVILAILFAGAMPDPVRNIWIVRFGIVSAVLVVPSAWLFGYMRGLPAIHYFVDASFGIGAVIPLILAHRILKKYDY